MLLRLWPLHQQTEVLLTFHRCLITTSPAGHLYVQRWAAVASVIIKKSIQLLWTHQSTIFSGFLRRFPIFPIFSLGKTILILSCCLLFLLRELNWERRFHLNTCNSFWNATNFMDWNTLSSSGFILLTGFSFERSHQPRPLQSPSLHNVSFWLLPQNNS